MSDEIRYYPPFTSGRPMPDAEQACDCGCMDIERGPGEDITYYVEPERQWPPATAGVEPGYLLIWAEGVEACTIIPAALLHDGEGRMVPQFDFDKARGGRIVDDR